MHADAAFDTYPDTTFAALGCDHWPDATFIPLGSAHGDVLAEPGGGQGDPLLLHALGSITIPPSDLPAADLPYGDPTPGELRAVASGGGENHLAAANVLAAYEASRRALTALRTRPAALAPDGETALGRAA
uniref:hypothetical protein n=1 Tax=Amycolatopsis sp. CA-096443 TaxID=3239919 RepID=UPI003F49135E